MAGKTRKPHGSGRLAVQRARREQLSQQIAATLVEKLDMETVEDTGALFPRRCNLKKK